MNSNPIIKYLYGQYNKKEEKMKNTGKVKWWNDAKGYGFLETNDIKDIFVHYSALKMDGFKTLKEDQNITFDLVSGPKGPQAFEVEILN